jgi:putative NADH-flavin reductase
MKIVIFGANGATGRLLTGQALAAGHDVAAVTRRPADFPITHQRLTVLPADVHNAQSVGQAVKPADVVLSAVGVPTRVTASMSTAMVSATSRKQCRSTG